MCKFNEKETVSQPINVTVFKEDSNLISDLGRIYTIVRSCNFPRHTTEGETNQHTNTSVEQPPPFFH